MVLKKPVAQCSCEDHSCVFQFLWITYSTSGFGFSVNTRVYTSAKAQKFHSNRPNPKSNKNTVYINALDLEFYLDPRNLSEKQFLNPSLNSDRHQKLMGSVLGWDPIWRSNYHSFCFTAAGWCNDANFGSYWTIKQRQHMVQDMIF